MRRTQEIVNAICVQNKSWIWNVVFASSLEPISSINNFLNDRDTLWTVKITAEYEFSYLSFTHLGQRKTLFEYGVNCFSHCFGPPRFQWTALSETQILEQRLGLVPALLPGRLHLGLIRICVQIKYLRSRIHNNSVLKSRKRVKMASNQYPKLNSRQTFENLMRWSKCKWKFSFFQHSFSLSKYK